MSSRANAAFSVHDCTVLDELGFVLLIMMFIMIYGVSWGEKQRQRTRLFRVDGWILKVCLGMPSPASCLCLNVHIVVTFTLDMNEDRL